VPGIHIDDTGFSADAFLALAQRVWPRDYDVARAADALTRTVNIGAWDGVRLVGAVRFLTDGYFFSCVSEILVDPDYQGQGIGRRLMDRALEVAPRGKLFLGAQPQSVGFFERLGYERGPVGFVAIRRGSDVTTSEPHTS
jgi:GNAT superfamily N-acetyltransferase